MLLSDHWSEADGGRRQRALRVPMLNAVLGHFGLQMTDSMGRIYVVRDMKGRAKVVPDLATLWLEAERLAGRPLDPLDPALVEALTPDG
jgi:hypothetical protein